MGDREDMDAYHYHGELYDHAVVVIHSENFVHEDPTSRRTPPGTILRVYLVHIEDDDDQSDDIIDMRYMISEASEVVDDPASTRTPKHDMTKHATSRTTYLTFRNCRILMFLLLVIYFLKQFIVVEAGCSFRYPDVVPTSDAIMHKQGYPASALSLIHI